MSGDFNRVFAARGWNLYTDLVYLPAIITGVFFDKKIRKQRFRLCCNPHRGNAVFTGV
jgi:hypothetical protein